MFGEKEKKLDPTRVAASLRGMRVGDALDMPAHWYYSPTALRSDYGEFRGMVAPKANHAESMLQGMNYTGSIDIMHDKARFYEGNTLAGEAKSGGSTWNSMRTKPRTIWSTACCRTTTRTWRAFVVGKIPDWEPCATAITPLRRYSTSRTSTAATIPPEPCSRTS